MELQVTTPDDTKSFSFNICFDPYGNIYFDGSENLHDPYFAKYACSPYNSLLFQLNIDRDNKPYMDNSNYEIINDNVEVTKLKLVEGENNDVYENNEIYDEQDEYIIELDEYGNEILCGDDNQPFVFYFNDNNIQINERENGDVCALYDTEVYGINNMPLIQSASGDNGSIYKLKIYLNNTIYFSCVGNTEDKYKLIINENGELLFVSN
jgi:hypothetical protein